MLIVDQEKLRANRANRFFIIIEKYNFEWDFSSSLRFSGFLVCWMLWRNLWGFSLPSSLVLWKTAGHCRVWILLQSCCCPSSSWMLLGVVQGCPWLPWRFHWFGHRTEVNFNIPGHAVEFQLHPILVHLLHAHAYYIYTHLHIIYTWKTIWTFFFDHTLLTIIFNHYGFFPNTATKPIYGVFCPYVFCSERIVGDLSEEARPRICFWGIIWWFSRSNQIWSQILAYLGPYLRGTSKILVDYQHFVEKIQYAYFNVWPQILPYLNRIWGRTASDKMFREK